LFTDIVGSTAPAEQLGDLRWHDLLDAHHTTVRRELARSCGNEVKSLGDGFLATFDGPSRVSRNRWTSTRLRIDAGSNGQPNRR
jgi:class 3 adenylate cyclase